MQWLLTARTDESEPASLARRYFPAAAAAAAKIACFATKIAVKDVFGNKNCNLYLGKLIEHCTMS
jgi:hypothetical protein